LKDHENWVLIDAEYLIEDRLHNEIELYDKQGRHLGILDFVTKQIVPNSQDKTRRM